MDADIHIAVATVVDDELVDAMRRLVPQLSSSVAPPGADQLREVVIDGPTTLLIARDSSRRGLIVGCLTLAVFRIPTGVRAWIEDVVVDEGVRGKGVGDGLCREALSLARAKGARTVELTSRPSREAANRLYRRLGFQQRETNVYRVSLDEEERH